MSATDQENVGPIRNQSVVVYKNIPPTLNAFDLQHLPLNLFSLNPTAATEQENGQQKEYSTAWPL